MIYQQGDVLLKSFGGPEAIAAMHGLRSVKGNSIKVDEGEASGHFHEAIGECLKTQNAVMDGIQLDGTMLLVSPNSFRLRHPEHAELMIPAGVWLVSKVVEYDHFSDGVVEARD